MIVVLRSLVLSAILTGAAAVAAAVDLAPLPLAVGGPAPSLKAPGVVVTAPGDSSTSGAMTLIFSKPDDAHTKDAVEAIQELHQRHTHVRDGSQTVVITSRVKTTPGSTTVTIPPTWRQLSDTQDTLYAAYHIIATPTLVIVDADNKIVGIHPGYSAALAGAVRRDLLAAIDGPESLNAATPTPGIMDIQMARALAKRRLYDRALKYYRSAAAAAPMPCDIALEEVAIHLELRQPAEALALLKNMGPDSTCAAKVEEMRKRAEAMTAAAPTNALKPPQVP